MANDNMNVVDRIRSGWGRFFSRENGRATETKYIPKSRFFSPSDLKELEKKEGLNPMEKRALEYGKIAAMQSNRSNIEYVPVLFDGTTLIAWNDGEKSPLADFRAKMMNDELKREGYQLSKELEQSILEEQGKALVDKLFIREGEEYIKVDSYSGDKEPSLSFTSYNIDTMESVNIPYDVRLFQEMLGREEMKEAETYNILDFDKKLQTLRESQNLLQDTVKFIEESKIYKGKLDISEGHEYSSLGDYSSHSWSYGAGNIEFYGYFEDDGDAIQTKVIDLKSAYHYRELLREVSDAVQREKVRNDVNAMKQALGKEPIQGDHQIAYLISQKDNLLKELLEAMDTTSSKAQGLSNTELEHRKDEAAFLKLNKALNAVTGSYDKSEKVLEDYEKSYGIHDNDISNMAKRMNSVSKYIDTLKDTRIPMSGDFQEHLPNYHHLRELYSKFESSEEELHGYSHSVGAGEGEYERLKVNYKNASDTFKKELTDILDYYENLMNLNGETIHENVQGLEYYDKRSLKNYILKEVTEKFVIGFEGDEITRVNDLEIHGSRGRGTARPDSDLDVVVEYEGSLREDDAFNFLNEDPLIYNGIKVDVNPIRKQETGTLQDYMVKSRKYDQQILKQLGEDNANKAEAEKKIRFSRVSTDIESLDTEYINAVKSGDMKKFWQAMASFLGIHYESAEQVADQVLKDMLNEVNPAKKLKEFTESRDDLYKEYVENGNMEKAFELVMEEASMKLAENPMPEVTDAYSVSHEQEPEATIKVYKVFTLDKDGDPSALFVSGKDKLPMGVWLNAQDTWHFTAANGKDYVPSTRNPNGRGSKTGSSVLIPNEQVRQELIQRGFLPEGSKAKYITALAYRPGWHAADLPYFPQGDKQDPESNYGNVHRSNQVVFECELSANKDYTETARSQAKAYNSDGKFVARNADLQYMPKNGYYQYTTNQFLKNEDKGHWYIGGAMKINRALTQEECDTILKENGKVVQEWENDILDLKKLNYATISSKVKPVLAPVMYDETGKMIPLSRRFEDSRTTINEPRRMFIGTIGAANVDTASKSVNLSSRLDLLSLAKQMNTAGSSAKDIKQITGWEIGADNNWKYETEDVKRFDWNGNILYEKNHPDFKRYMELVNKDNEHIFCEGEALRPSEVEEYDRLAEEYGGLDGKLDNHTMLDAYIDAPDVFEAYPELRNVKVEFEALKGNEKACFTSAHNYLDRLFDVDESLKFGGTITINTNKLNRFQDEKDIRGIIGHEIQHAVQEIEGFARGGAPQTIRKEIQENVACHQAEKDFIVSNLKQWAVLTDMANRLEASRKELQRDGKVWQEIGRRHYWDAMNEIDTNPNEKYKLENEYEKVFGKDFDDLEVAKSGYHVKEATIELRRQAQVCKDELTTSDKITLKQMTIMEESLKNNSDNQIYWKLAGEVEARNTSKRVGMTPLQRRNTLASETEDVDRKEQIVIKESPQRNYVTLSSPSTGRWHTADNEQREACEGYAELISKAIKCNLVWNDDSIGKAYNLNGQPFDIGDSYILSLHCNKNGHNTPVFATEQEVRQLNMGVWEKAKPFSLIKNGEVKKLYNIENLSSFPQRLEIIKQIEDRETMKKAKANALSVFPVGKYPELDMTVKEDVQLDYNERRDLAKNLLDYVRGKMPDSYEAKSKEALVRSIAMGMLGNLYEFQYSEKVPGSNGLIARLERDPAFSKEILDKASASAAKVSTFVEENVRSFGEDKKLDLRSLTPIDMDVDGNGIVESQENLAADKKQGEDEPASQSQDTSHKHKGRVV